MRTIAFFTVLFFIHSFSFGQLSQKGEVWGAYVSTMKLSKRLALWNDFHYATNAFFISRHGLSVQINRTHEITAGYAYVLTSTSYTNQLVRNEHRPFAHYVGRFPLGKKWFYQVRFRQDLRIRRNLGIGELNDGFSSYHRSRLMHDVRYFFKDFGHNKKLHVDLMSELLVHYGKTITNGIDQHRLYGLIGYTHKNITFFTGYHWRHIPNSANIHGWTLWVIQNLDIRNKNKKDEK